MSSRRETIRHIADALAGLYGRHEAETVARTVLSDMEGTAFSHLIAFPDEECTLENTEIERITAELAAGRPLQYVLGHCEFCGLDFEVGEGVLIPRPETEELVAAVVERANGGDSVLDLCTGSGCIAIALAKKLNNSSVTAADISEKALDYARRNAAKNHVLIEFIDADIFQADFTAGGMFDIIVSNPPYVPRSDMDGMHINVKGFEPHEALFVPDDNPLLFYERIADIGRKSLRCGGLLCFEVYELYAERTAAMLREKGYRQTETINDANLKPRIVCCRK